LSDGSAVTAAYKVGARLAQALPGALVEPVSRASGRVFKLAMRGRRDTVARHLRRVYGPSLKGAALDRAVDASFLSYARYWVESFRVPTTSKADIAARFTTEGIHHMLDPLADGRGVILALPHLGGWEWAGRWVADQGIPITVVVEPLEPPELFEWFVSYRRSLGMHVVPVGLGAAMASIKALRGNGVLCLLCDRDIGTGGVEVEFFGERTKLPAGPATLSLRTGAPILPTAVYYEAGGLHVGSVGAPIEIEPRGSIAEDIATLTQALAHRLEVLIRAAPEQWHLFQPNWPSDPGYSG
jgi:KDO2-lipid IV(A) lauroyltransferase